MSQLNDRLEAAIDVLISDGPIKQRLAHAYADNLEDLTCIELSEAGGETLNQLHQVLHGVTPVSRETAVQASVRKMSAHEARVHARSILDLYRAVISTGRRSEHLTIVDPTPLLEDDLPRFLMAGG
jgi:hypothetical protein